MSEISTSPPTERQIQVAQRGIIVPGIDLIMETLQCMYPRLEFRKTPSGDWSPVYGTPWRRGGTTPGGSNMSGPIGANGAAPGQVVNDTTGNYFIGAAEDKVEAVAPQRINWFLPEVDEERYGPPSSVGWIVGQGGQILRPASMADLMQDSAGMAAPQGYGSAGVGGTTGVGALGGSYPDQAAASGAGAPLGMSARGGAGAMGGADQVVDRTWATSELGNVPWARNLDTAGVPGAVPGGNGLIGPAGIAWSPARTKVVPMRARVWGNDLDDTELLGLQLACACETVFQGTLAHMGEQTLVSSGWVRDEKGTRGMHWQLRVNFACQVVFPPQPSAALKGVGIRTGS